MDPLPEAPGYRVAHCPWLAEKNFDVAAYLSALSSQSNLDYNAEYGFLHRLDNNVAN